MLARGQAQLQRTPRALQQRLAARPRMARALQPKSGEGKEPGAGPASLRVHYVRRDGNYRVGVRCTATLALQRLRAQAGAARCAPRT